LTWYDIGNMQETKSVHELRLYPLQGGFKVGDRVVDTTAEANGWPDLHGVVEEVDGSNVKVRYESGSVRWKMHINLRLRDQEQEGVRVKDLNSGEEVKVGDYVTATLAIKTSNGEREVRQGVFVRDNGDGTIVVQGEIEEYICDGSSGVKLVPDSNLFGETLSFVETTRRQLSL